MNFDLYIGTSGLDADDLAFRLYRWGVPVELPTGFEFSALPTAVDYVVDGLPEDGQYALTWSYGGASGVKSWGDEAGPLQVVIPARESGLVEADFSLVLFRDGALYADPFDFAEVGDVGDYVVSGWPQAGSRERWLLRWTRGAAVFGRDWRGPWIPTSIVTLEDAIHGHFATWWEAQPSIVGGVTWPLPPVRAPNSPWRPSPGEPYVELHLIWATRTLFGTADQPIREGRGILQVDHYVAEGEGDRLHAFLADMVERCWIAARSTISGLRTYATLPNRPLPPFEGWDGRHSDTDFLWIVG